MKTQYMLKPLVLALAAVLSAGAYAGSKGGGYEGGNGGYEGGGSHNNPPQQQQQPQYGGNATVVDSQDNHHNNVLNEGTNNNASVTDSLGNASGNVGVNVAAGDNNQQANAAAIAVADATLVFGGWGQTVGSASANISVKQTDHDNLLNNFSVPNNASLSGSANGASGNVGINIAAGNYNQQKNDMAIGVSETANLASAGSNVSQVSNNNITNNKATMEYGSKEVRLSMNAGGGYAGGGVGGYSGEASGTTTGRSEQIGDVYLDTWTGTADRHGNVHAGGNATGHIDVDDQVQGASDLNNDGGAFAFKEDGSYSGTEGGDLGFVEAGLIGLKGSVTGSIPMVAGFKAPVVNNASVSNSLNNASGNVGVNVAAGGGNQQSNSLSVAVGCTACATGI